MNIKLFKLINVIQEMALQLFAQTNFELVNEILTDVNNIEISAYRLQAQLDAQNIEIPFEYEKQHFELLENSLTKLTIISQIDMQKNMPPNLREN